MKKSVISTLILLLATSVFSQVTTKELAVAYIRNYSSMAVREMKRSKVPASITLAQGMLESDYGRSDLAKESLNHFGIKCGKDWTGDKIYHDDDAKNDCFRKYESVEDSYSDHSEFLAGRDRYASLFELATTDYKGWATGLRRAGYATDPNYSNRLIKIIEENNLSHFDSDSEGVVLKPSEKGQKVKTKKITDKFVVDPFFSHEVKYNNGVRYVDVKDGDTFERITREFGLKSWELAKYNELNGSQTIDDLNYLYISPKRNKAHVSHNTHTVRKGDTLFSISNKYGVKLSKLMRYNRLNFGSSIKVGDILNLRKRKLAN